MFSDWHPTAPQSHRHARAQLLKTLRQFFEDRNVLEVDTPLLSHGTVTDVHLSAFSCDFRHSHTGQAERLYLQTSPEYAMKRLLCAQSGAIYQICKAFRHEGAGRWHNPEFTMLEWYRPNFNHHALMKEVDELLQITLATEPADTFTYQHLFDVVVNLDPLVATEHELEQAMVKFGIDVTDTAALGRDDKLQLLFSGVIEPAIGSERPCFVHGFPASQAALARLNPQDPRIADRFEVYFKGAELANGFYELANADEQRKRFENDNRLRLALGLDSLPVDEHFLHALEHGLPDCAGVALGIDRLLMLKTGATHIQEVLNFPISRA
ncbi:elongation factor P--(R)-beta-lysine ligase [Alteromonas pelagimontana]|uniref:Elongation factor P--(R)-beta-lysine ligase n=1 Tax=Alteromonas pelagimontana TaxID=1858656 RepID=A0A6M4MC34_9ALTE|nr:elongation factor P--(R)-beta-lysine ligase [Alteromonas pelagimontana]QJR80368.1 elongation factor P--(R)-beta-lysine ligase [Alteromonas pelagimontana]